MNTRTNQPRLSTLFTDRKLAAIFAACERDLPPGRRCRHQRAGPTLAEPRRGPPVRKRLTHHLPTALTASASRAGAVSFATAPARAAARRLRQSQFQNPENGLRRRSATLQSLPPTPWSHALIWGGLKYAVWRRLGFATPCHRARRPAD
jgi:hypothetical protein